MSGIFSFDPDAYVAAPAAAEPEPVSDLYAMPPEWRHGLALLADRGVPRGAGPDRWAQILADATKLATHWAPLAIQSGWTIENLFGFDPAGTSRAYGLAVALRGRRLIGFTDDAAIMRKHVGPVIDPTSDWFAHYPILEPGAPLLWSFDDRIS